MRPVYKDVLLFCPDDVTGGPEAMHQLAHAINNMGGRARMVYFGSKFRLEMKGNFLRNHMLEPYFPEAYARYQPQLAEEAELDHNTLIVYPEILSAEASAHALNRRALWWLSVDNAMNNNTRLVGGTYRNKFFADEDLIHLYQSDYARQFLEECKAKKISALSDYTDPQFTDNAATVMPITARGDLLCFFPAKGAELARDFFARATSMRSSINAVPIRQMTKDEVRDTLSQAKIYIDFGNHPGKDRVPREAAVAGAIVLLHAAGAGKNDEDHPLSDFYRFTRDDVLSGRLHQRVDTILDEPEMHFAIQHAYRHKVLQERHWFEDEVADCFFTQDE